MAEVFRTPSRSETRWLSWAIHMKRRTISLVLVSLAAASMLSGAGQATSPPDLDAYRGLGTWVDIYDKHQYYNPAPTVAQMAARGVRTLYLETGNYKAKKDMVFPGEVDRFIDAAHANGMRIVAWYLPSFQDLTKDLRRSLAAINRETANGGRFDSFGLDIEASVVSDPNVRTARLLRLSSELRAAVGPSYPLSAIIPSPRGMQYRPTYWPGFPFRDLAQYYDVFQPMSYYSFRVNNAAGAYKYIADNISIVRSQTGDKTIPIHIIGGIADASTEAMDRALVHAARERGILGASLYDFATSTDEDWVEMAKVPPIPVERPALPLSLPAAPALGNIPGGDRSHPQEVFYRTGDVRGPATLHFQAFDVQKGEVAILVNWRWLKDVVSTGGSTWSGTRTARIPRSYLYPNASNVIGFVGEAYPHWGTWGVRQVSLG
jgi:hypothetical protein